MGFIKKLKEFFNYYPDTDNNVEKENEKENETGSIEEYNLIKTLYSQTFFNGSYSEQYQSIGSVLESLAKILPKNYDVIIKKESENRGNYIYHPVFKCLFAHSDYISEIVQKLKREQKDLIFKARNEDIFENDLIAIRKINIQCTETTKQERKYISEFPEIKFSPIGSSFNQTKLMNFISVDVETTGLKATQNEIIQLSAIKFEDFEPVSAFTTYLKPHKGLKPEAQKINGITEEDVSHAPYIETIISSFVDFCGNFPIIGYNLTFDLKFLYMAGFPLDVKRKYYDIYTLIKKRLKGLDSYSLDDVCYELDIYRKSKHDALSDAYACKLVLDYILSEI